jgi:trans-aconitate methyltransferase
MVSSPVVSTEWNAAQYHRVSEPQFEWGIAVLARLALDGDEHVVDAGCGSGRLTAKLLERLPAGRVTAIDRSANMLHVARAQFRPAFDRRVQFVQADLALMPLCACADVIFSTATFHWVLDHDRLFRSLRSVLRDDGRLHAQCGGGPNLDRILTRARALMTEPPFAGSFDGWRNTTLFATPEVTAERLIAAGFVDVETSLEPAPARFASRDEFAAFVSVVVLRTHLARLSESLQRTFVARIADAAAGDDPPFTLDYWRLNLRGRVAGRR